MNLLKKNKGYSIFELVVIILIMMIIGSVIATIVVSSMDIYTTTTHMSSSNFGARRISDLMLRDIRQIKDKKSIYIATSNTFKFMISSGDIITYVYHSDKKNIEKAITTGNKTVVDNNFHTDISDFLFIYMDANGKTLNTNKKPLEFIRKLQLVFVDSLGAGQNVFTSKCYLRNTR